MTDDTTSPRNLSESPAGPPSAAETARTAPRSDAQPDPAPEVTPDAERASVGLRKLAEAATPGPWYAPLDTDQIITGGGVAVVWSIAYSYSYSDSEVEMVPDDRAYIAAANPAAVLALLAERDDLAAKLAAAEAELTSIREADREKLSIQFGWLTYDVGEHTCGGYGPGSGYIHEPGCGHEPLLRLDDLPGWPDLDRAERIADATTAERDALRARLDAVLEVTPHPRNPATMQGFELDYADGYNDCRDEVRRAAEGVE